MIAILHNIRSIHNVGAMFRTAEACGLEKIYLTGYTPTPLDRLGQPRPAFAKVSLGAEKYLAWESFSSITSVLKKLKQEEFKLFAIEQASNSIPYYKVKLSLKQREKVAFILGNEVRGLSKSVLEKSDKILELPMKGKKESLNVAVAFGIIAYHLTFS